MEVILLAICPIKSLMRRIATVNKCGPRPDHPLCVILGAASQSSYVSDGTVREVVRQAVTSLGLAAQGIQAHQVGTHSLCAGGASATIARPILCFNATQP